MTISFRVPWILYSQTRRESLYRVHIAASPAPKPFQRLILQEKARWRGHSPSRARIWQVITGQALQWITALPRVLRVPTSSFLYLTVKIRRPLNQPKEVQVHHLGRARKTTSAITPYLKKLRMRLCLIPQRRRATYPIIRYRKAKQFLIRFR